MGNEIFTAATDTILVRDIQDIQNDLKHKFNVAHEERTATVRNSATYADEQMVKSLDKTILMIEQQLQVVDKILKLSK